MIRIASLAAILSAAALPAMAGAATTLADGSFEVQGAASSNGNGFCYFSGGTCAAGAWTGTQNSGLQVETNTAWPGTPSPAGTQYGFVQDRGTLSQSFTSTSTTGLTLGWLAAGRPVGCCGGNQTYEVRLTNDATGVTTLLATDTTTTGQTFAARTSGRFVIGTGSYTLTFAGLNPVGGDNTSFVDGVAFAAVPEPATWGLMALGFGLAGTAMRRRRMIVAA